MLVGLTLVVIGAIFLLQNLGFLTSNAWQIIWPIIIIILGATMLMKKKGSCHLPWCRCGKCSEEDKPM